MQIYLDSNATTQLHPQAWEAMLPYFTQSFGNPSSSHTAGRKARQALEDAREQIATLLNAHADEVIFTSGATEANNLALFGLTHTKPGAHLLVAPIEHPCIIEPTKQLQKRGYAVEWLPVNALGIIEQHEVLNRIRDDTALVSIMLANHETGAIQPVWNIAKSIPKQVQIHTDAAQAIGKIPVNFRDLGVHSLSISAHKFGGPKGIGALLLKRGTPLYAQMFGGHQQKGHRPGTEPVAFAVGMATALQYAIENRSENAERMEQFKLRFWEQLQSSNPIVNGPMPDSHDVLPSTLNISFPGCRSELLLMKLDLAGVACSTGSACSSGSLLPSPVLEAMRVPHDVLDSAMRFSFAGLLNEADVDAAAGIVLKCVGEMQNPQE